MNQSIDIYDKTERDGERGKYQCRITMKLIFEEYWDFMLKFIDWRSGNLENQFAEKK